MKETSSVYERFGKRWLDILLSLLAIIGFGWLFLILAILVRSKLGSPILFSQVRPGKDGKLFRLYKFRSMTDETDEQGNLLPDEQRMTEFGKKLRSTSLDELPEIFNILKGEMSWVGPRPQLVRDMVFFTEEEMKRQSVFPGLTGLAQVSGRNNIDWKERFRYDLQYVEQLSLLEDCKILWKTVFKVTAGADVATDGMETSEDYGDWLLREGKISEDIYREKQKQALQMLETYETKTTAGGTMA